MTAINNLRVRSDLETNLRRMAAAATLQRNLPVDVDWKGVILKAPMSAVVRQSLERLQQGEFFLPVIGPNTSAWGYACSRSLTFFLSAAKVYVPVHMISLIFRLRHLSQQIHKEKKLAKQEGREFKPAISLRTQIFQLLIRYLSGVLRSSLFVGIFASSISLSRSKLLGTHKVFTSRTGSWAGLSMSGLFAAGIFVESSSRWADMSVYVLAQWLEALPRFLLRRTGLQGADLDHKFALGEKLLLALGMGILLAVRYWEEVAEQGGKNGKLLDLFVGDLSFSPQLQSTKMSTDKELGKPVKCPSEDHSKKPASQL